MGSELDGLRGRVRRLLRAPSTPWASPPGPRRSRSRCARSDIGAGDEVIVPTNSFIATAEAVSLAGATPRLVDVDPETHLLTAEAVEAAIGPRTRARHPGPPDGLDGRSGPDPRGRARRTACGSSRTPAQAHGAFHRGRRVGTLGDVGCFSFYPTKNLGGWGDGGAVVTDDPALADRVRLLRSHGERPRYHHRIVGTTARLDAPPGRDPAREAAAARRLERRPPPAGRRAARGARRHERGAARARLRGRRPRVPPVHRPLERPRRAARAPRRSTASRPRCTTRSRSTGPGRTPTSASAAARLRRPSAWPSRSARCPCSRRCPTTRSAQVVAAVASFE